MILFLVETFRADTVLRCLISNQDSLSKNCACKNFFLLLMKVMKAETKKTFLISNTD